jgi:hypothetical protein
MALSGCSSTPRHLTLGPDGENRLPASDYVNVALTPSAAGWEDNLHVAFGPKNLFIATGPIWQRAFIGIGADLPSFDLQASSLDMSMAAGGFATRYTYTATGILTVNGKQFHVSANGTRAAAMNLSYAQTQAVELGVDDAAKQVAKILAENQNP